MKFAPNQFPSEPFFRIHIQYEYLGTSVVRDDGQTDGRSSFTPHRPSVSQSPSNDKISPLSSLQKTNNSNQATMASRRLLARTAVSSRRLFSSEQKPFISERVEELFTTMAALPKEEVGMLGPLLSEKLGIPMPPENARPMVPVDNDNDEDVAEAAVVEEKIVFDLRLVAFDAKSKIKVIKEVRAIAGLGLKEAKELVEGAPKVVKKDIKKEEAEELQKKLEEAGATIEVV